MKAATALICSVTGPANQTVGTSEPRAMGLDPMRDIPLRAVASLQRGPCSEFTIFAFCRTWSRAQAQEPLHRKVPASPREKRNVLP